MANTLIELEDFSPPRHAKHVLVKKEGDVVTVRFMDLYYNKQGSMDMSTDNAKLLVKELMDELYGSAPGQG